MAVDRPPQGALQAIDEAIPGGLQERRPEFALYCWDTPAVDQFNQWDSISSGLVGASAEPYLAFVSRAVVDTLREYPWINGELRGDQIVTRNFVNLGFAVELADGKGLIVPVVKNCEGLNLLGLARAVVDIAQRARDKKLLPDDVQGGTFTITNYNLAKTK